ncbi:MAG TPA: radical SAM protein, partial [bacterium]|nr:radical SAM protein [bacterium]HEX68387.1 radical SAM protein [bacterium]
MRDSLGREINYLRISLTDRCNLNCFYCSRLSSLNPRPEVLSLEEIAYWIGVFMEWGIKKVRFTGGEPFLRKGWDKLVEFLLPYTSRIEFTVTTNGVLLDR